MVLEKRTSGIKSLPLEDRPREKLALKGAFALSNTELLAIIISTGTKSQTAIDIARNILQSVDNDISRLSTLTLGQLKKIKGIGDAKAITIAAALELIKRKNQNGEKVKITKSRDIYDYMYAELAEQLQENFYVILLNKSNQVMKHHHISLGSTDATIVDKKVVFKEILIEQPSSIILVHNHPSGNRQPSDQDIKMTKEIKEGASLFDIKLLDHIIFTNTGYFSFADEGLL